MKNYLIMANYESFSLEQLYKEKNSDEYGGILWANKRHFDYKKNDNIFVYYAALPDKIARILFVGRVISKMPYDKNKDGVLIKINTALNPSNKDMFCAKNLRKYGINCFQNDVDLSEIKFGSKLCQDIQKVIDKGEKQSFKSVVDSIFKVECECKNLNGGKGHIFFQKENGMNFFHQHHFIPQKCRRELGEQLIDSDANLVQLCTLCHDKIHYADYNTRKTLINHIYKKNICKLIELGFKENVEWFYEKYIDGYHKSSIDQQQQ